jgi:hypothetical protein
LAPIAIASVPEALAAGPMLLTLVYWVVPEMPATVALREAMAWFVA